VLNPTACKPNQSLELYQYRSAYLSPVYVGWNIRFSWKPICPLHWS